MAPFNVTGIARLVSELAWQDTYPARSEILVPDPVTTLLRLVKIHIAHPMHMVNLVLVILIN